MVAWLVVGAIVLSCLPALAEPPELPIMTYQKTVYADRVEYVSSIDYTGDYGYTGRISDFHAHLCEWTPGEMTITPPANWAGLPAMAGSIIRKRL